METSAHKSAKQRWERTCIPPAFLSLDSGRTDVGTWGTHARMPPYLGCTCAVRVGTCPDHGGRRRHRGSAHGFSGLRTRLFLHCCGGEGGWRGGRRKEEGRGGRGRLEGRREGPQLNLEKIAHFRPRSFADAETALAVLRRGASFLMISCLPRASRQILLVNLVTTVGLALPIPFQKGEKARLPLHALLSPSSCWEQGRGRRGERSRARRRHNRAVTPLCLAQLALPIALTHAFAILTVGALPLMLSLRS